MIRQWENGVRIVTLGEGTTWTSVVLLEGDPKGIGISFASGNFGAEGAVGQADVPSDTVIVEIRDTKGAASYLRALTELFRTWAGDNETLRKSCDGMDQVCAELEAAAPAERAESGEGSA